MKDFPQNDAIRIVKSEQEGDDGIFVTFSDGTVAGYVVEELVALRPAREQAPGRSADRRSPEQAPVL